MSEKSFIKNIARLANSLENFYDLKTGIGDDAAVIDRGDFFELISTDMFVEGDHFNLDWFSFAEVAAKCMEASLSDIYAMRGRPRYVFLSIAVSPKISDANLEVFFEEIFKKCKEHKVVLAGGDTTHGDLFVVDVMVVGEVKKENICLRSGGKNGDLIGVTGNLGGSMAGLKLFRKFGNEAKNLKQFEECIKKHLQPRCRADLTENDLEPVNSLIDVSDGVGAEVRNLCNSNNLGAVIYKNKIPLADSTKAVANLLNEDPYLYAISGGEDFELIFTVPEEKISELNFSFHIIGKLRADKALLLEDNGVLKDLPDGYDHFNLN